MTAPNDSRIALVGGGPAFPSHASIIPKSGMSLRDYFAAKAMAALILADGIQYAQSEAQAHARLAYINADAMLAARSQP